jgi:hypothetical protein
MGDIAHLVLQVTYGFDVFWKTIDPTMNSKVDFKDENLYENVETANLNICKMFGNSLVKIFKFLKTLYSFYKFW